jgi:hypothetical protein
MSDLLRHLPAFRLAMYQNAHPELHIYQDEFGNHYAWKPSGDGGELTYGRTEKELLGKLERAGGGG